ncbi:MAG TPA: exopolysaccharide biosynthesis protein [Vicinamibacteria bacterium]|nr:exopolysaccharide biosynthesis protein [Vicinamibacteria bacterium]
MALPVHRASRPATRLGQDLARVRGLAAGRAVPLAAVLDSMDERGFALAVVLLTFPFVLPVPMMGLATPVGAALAFAAMGLVLGRAPRIPAALGRVPVAPRALDLLGVRLDALVGRARILVQPRLAFMLGRGMRVPLGLSLLVGAVILALPIPLPLSNFFPAAAILLLAAGHVEGDGLLVLLGHLATWSVCAGMWLVSGAVWSALVRAAGWLP